MPVALRHRAALLAVLTLAVVPPARAQQAPPPAPPAAAQGLDPGSPMQDLPGIGVDWPDLSKAPDGQDKSASQSQAAPDSRYLYRLEGLGDAAEPLLHQRFNEGSSLRAHQGQTANAAQIDRRAREDAQLLSDLLRAEGYYAARVVTQVAPEAGGRLVVTLAAEPGPLYHFSEIKLAGLDETDGRAAALSKAFGVAPQDAVDADKVTAGLARLRAAIGEQGFPFADVTDPVITVDHRTRTAKLVLELNAGGMRKFGAIHMADTRLFGARHVAEIARFRPGETYNQAGVDDLKRTLVLTGLVSSVAITPQQGAAPDTVDLKVALEPAPPRTIAGQIGYGTGEGAQIEVDWTHRNFVHPEGALALRGVLGTREQLASATLRFNNFHTRDHVLTTQFAASHTVRDAYDARTLEFSGSLEQQTNIFFQKKWIWSFGGDFAASDERDVDPATNLARRRVYYIAAVPLNLSYDGSDDLLDPTRGFRLGARVSPELSLNGRAFGYARVQLDASVYHPVMGSVVLASRVRIGTIVGAPRDAVAPSRRFYAGGGASVRGYSYQGVGPRDAGNNPIGGKGLAEFSIEARVKLLGSFGLVPFLDGGNVSTSSLPRVQNFRWGTGLGFRYYSGFGPIRLDIATPLTPQKGDPRVAIYVSLGQAF